MVTWEDVIVERRATLETFESLSPDQWERPSLCTGWTVRVVLGHLIVAADPRLRHWAEPMTDAMLHGLDVRLPLGLPPARPPEHWLPGLGLMFSRRGLLGFVPRGRPSLRWIATDHDWSHGEGPEVRGEIGDLALAASGRGVRVDHLEGPGQAALAEWLRP